MILKEIPEGSKLVVTTEDDGKQHPATFHHIDGMYSYCTIDDVDYHGQPHVFHLAIWTKMKKVGDHYEIE